MIGLITNPYGVTIGRLAPSASGYLLELHQPNIDSNSIHFSNSTTGSGSGNGAKIGITSGGTYEITQYEAQPFRILNNGGFRILAENNASHTTSVLKLKNNTAESDIFVSTFANPNLALTGDMGDLALLQDGAVGSAWIKYLGNGNNTGWERLIRASEAYINGGNAYGASATIGLTDDFRWTFLQNNKTWMTTEDTTPADGTIETKMGFGPANHGMTITTNTSSAAGGRVGFNTDPNTAGDASLNLAAKVVFFQNDLSNYSAWGRYTVGLPWAYQYSKGDGFIWGRTSPVSDDLVLSLGNLGVSIGGAVQPHTRLQSGGSFATKYNTLTTVTVNTLDITHSIIGADATTAPFTVTLPTAVGIAGRQYTIKKTDATANAVTVDGDASETIDGATTYPLASQYNSVTIVSDGANWLIIATI